MNLIFHPLSEAFPLIEGEEFNLLVGDIRDNGLRKRIDLYENAILDGRNRFNALKQLTETGEILGPGWGHREGECLDHDMLVPAPDNFLFRAFNPAIDGDPIGYVASLNLRRRDLAVGQRAYAVAELGRLGWGGNRSKPSGEGLSAERRAELGGVGRATVERAQVVVDRGIPDLKQALKDGDLATAPAERIARLPEAEQPAALEKALPNGARAIMGSRKEPDDSLDYFPTPPWATRALIEHVFPQIGLDVMLSYTAWEPACGEGHIAEVLAEYFGKVSATDVHDYGYGGLHNFLTEDRDVRFDWIITNPPFGDKSEQFVLRALARAQYGVAMFVRLQWLETNGRYERIFRDHPPTKIAFFAERVPLCKGRWNPDGDTATAYVWLVWDKYEEPQPPFWIPPDCRKALTRPGDVERFTRSPVQKIDHSQSESNEGQNRANGTEAAADGVASRVADGRTSDAGASTDASASIPPSALAPAMAADTATSPGLTDHPVEVAVDFPSDPLDLPAFLKRDAETNAAPFAKGALA